jgi:hypothetical protein
MSKPVVRKRDERGRFVKAATRALTREASDALYQKLIKIANCPSVAFINFPTGSDTIRRRSVKPHYQKVPWSRLACRREMRIGKLTLKTDCVSRSQLGQQKVFVKGYDDLLDYARALASKRISKKDHTALFRYLSSKPGTLVNHNLDLGTLHFKYV